MQERQSYIDVAKGLLMIGLILHHLPQAAIVLLKYDTPSLHLCDDATLIYSVFFMQVFFMITGHCSNFNRDPKTFVINLLKTLVLPSFVFSLIIVVFYSLLDDGRNVINGEKNFLLHLLRDGFSCYWFLNSLIVCKLLIYSFVRLLPRKWMILGLLICLYFIGIALNNLTSLYNIWNIENTMVMALFMYIGYLLKGRNIQDYKSSVFIGAGVIYLALLALIYITLGREFIPTSTAHIHIRLFMAVPFIIMVILGSMGFMYLSKCINNNKVLEYIGKGSLVFYCVHHPWLLFYERLYVSRFDISSWGGIFLFYVTVTILTLLTCITFVYIFNQKYFRWVIGR